MKHSCRLDCALNDLLLSARVKEKKKILPASIEQRLLVKLDRCRSGITRKNLPLAFKAAAQWMDFLLNETLHNARVKLDCPQSPPAAFSVQTPVLVHSFMEPGSTKTQCSFSLSSGATLLLEAPEIHMQSTAAQNRGSFTFSVNLSHVNSEHKTASGVCSTLKTAGEEKGERKCLGHPNPTKATPFYSGPSS